MLARISAALLALILAGMMPLGAKNILTLIFSTVFFRHGSGVVFAKRLVCVTKPVHRPMTGSIDSRHRA